MQPLLRDASCAVGIHDGPLPLTSPRQLRCAQPAAGAGSGGADCSRRRTSAQGFSAGDSVAAQSAINAQLKPTLAPTQFAAAGELASPRGAPRRSQSPPFGKPPAPCQVLARLFAFQMSRVERRWGCCISLAALWRLPCPPTHRDDSLHRLNRESPREAGTRADTARDFLLSTRLPGSSLHACPAGRSPAAFADVGRALRNNDG